MRHRTVPSVLCTTGWSRPRSQPCGMTDAEQTPSHRTPVASSTFLDTLTGTRQGPRVCANAGGGCGRRPSPGHRSTSSMPRRTELRTARHTGANSPVVAPGEAGCTCASPRWVVRVASPPPRPGRVAPTDGIRYRGHRRGPHRSGAARRPFSSARRTSGLRSQGPSSAAGMTAIPSLRRCALVTVVTTAASSRSPPIFARSHSRCWTADRLPTRTASPPTPQPSGRAARDQIDLMSAVVQPQWQRRRPVRTRGR